MFRTLLSLNPASLWALALGAPCAAMLLAFARRAVLTYRISKSPGVRAPILADNPLSGLLSLSVSLASPPDAARQHPGSWLTGSTAIYVFMFAAWKQANNRLLEYFEWIYHVATPECPNCVEVSFNGGRRFLMTREPEHVKTVLTSKFAQFGKGPEFHETWSPFLGDSIFTTDGQLWQNSRALIRPMFIKEKVRDLEIFERWTDVLVSKLPPAGQTVDICDLFYRMTLDVTTDFLLGQSVGSLEKYVMASGGFAPLAYLARCSDASSPNGDFAKAFMEVQRMQMILTILA